MTLVHYYFHAPVTNAIALVTERGFSARAELGQPETIMVTVDDPGAVHDFRGLRSWYMVETAIGPTDRVWSGYVWDQHLSDEAGAIVFPQGTERGWELEIFEANGLLARTVYHPDDADANRPRETVDERMAWFIDSFPFVGVALDHGLVQSSSLVMPPSDYRRRRPIDALTDMSLLTNYNGFLRYRQASDDVELIFHEFRTSGLDPSTLRISNDPDDYDAVAGTDDTWPPEPGGKLDRAVSRLGSGFLVTYGNGGAWYQQDATTLADRGPNDQVAASTVPKILTDAQELATELLARFNEEDERITTRIQLPADKLNIALHGQLIEYRNRRWPGWDEFRPVRIARKAFSRPENESQAVYDVDLELTPACRLVESEDNQALAGAVSAYATTNGVVDPVFPPADPDNINDDDLDTCSDAAGLVVGTGGTPIILNTYSVNWEVALPEAITISQARYWLRNDSGSGLTHLEYSADGDAWVDAGGSWVVVGGSPIEYDYDISPAISARYWRFRAVFALYGLGFWPAMHICEVGLFGLVLEC